MVPVEILRYMYSVHVTVQVYMATIPSPLASFHSQYFYSCTDLFSKFEAVRSDGDCVEAIGQLLLDWVSHCHYDAIHIHVH